MIARYVVIRTLGALASLVFVVVLNFFLFRVLPGDPAKTLGRGRLNSQREVDAFRETYGLDQKLPEQFVTYIGNLLRGEMGLAISTRAPVSELIGDRIWPTLLLVGTSAVLSMMIGMWLGINQAWRRGSRFDRMSNVGGLTLYSMPEWWLGMLLIAVLAVGPGPLPGLFPTGGLHSSGVDPGSWRGVVDTAWHLTLPVMTLTLAFLAEFALVVRSAVLDELGEDYLTTARAKGLRDVTVRNRHAVRNALLPASTLIALNFGFIISGAITVETIFSIEGLGLLAVEGLRGPDLWLLQGTFLVSAGAVIIANLLANLLYAVIDPRVRT
jgi:peptide/nickel transport system permease protein